MKDYSGLTFQNQNYDGSDLSSSFFNGSSFYNCAFNSANLSHIEFGEAEISKCHFANCDISGSDFVLSNIEDSIFSNCKFANGEWREASYINCTFIDCDFHFDTINLCTFQNCTFEGKSHRSLNLLGVNFNVFIRCSFTSGRINKEFTEKNFGIKGIETMNGVLSYKSSSLALLSLDYYYGIMNSNRFLSRIIDFIIFVQSNNIRTYQMQIKYLRNICQMVIKNNDISLIGICALHDSLMGIISNCKDTFLFSEITSLILFLRKEILYKAGEIDLEIAQYYNYRVNFVEISIERTLNKEEVEIIIQYLICFLNIKKDGMQHSVRYGSTEIFINFHTIVEVGIFFAGCKFLFKSLNLALSELHISIQHVEKIGKDIYRISKEITKKAGSEKLKNDNEELALINVDNPTGNSSLIEALKNKKHRYQIQIKRVATEMGDAPLKIDDKSNIVIYLEKK